MEDFFEQKSVCLSGLDNGFNVTDYLNLRAKASLTNNREDRKPKSSNSIKVQHQQLLDTLSTYRNLKAEEADIPKFQVFTQKALFNICEHLPISTAQLRRMQDIGKKRIQYYGEDILTIVKEYVAKHSLDTTEDIELPKVYSNSKLESLRYLKEGMDIATIAKTRNLVTGTIESHLSTFLETGEVSIEDLMPKEKYNELRTLMQNTEFEGLSDLKNKIDDAFTYSEMRWVQKML